MLKEFLLVMFACIMCANCERKMMMPGGLSPMNMSDKDVALKVNSLVDYGVNLIAEKRMAENKKKFGLSTINNNKTLKYSARVVSAQSQIVAGALYHLVVRMTDANCKRNCPVEECKMKIWERPWENFRNMTEFSCKAVKESPLSGGWKEVSLNDAKNLKALDHLVNTVNLASNSLYHQKLVDVTKAQKQVVNGLKYEFEFSMGQTSCTKNNKEVNLKECSVANGAKTINCSGSVVERLWLPNPYSDVSFKCQ